MEAIAKANYAERNSQKRVSDSSLNSVDLKIRNLLQSSYISKENVKELIDDIERLS